MNIEVEYAFDAWWRGLARQGDPQRRPLLIEEAFEAGFNIARALHPPAALVDEDQKRTT